MGSRWSAMTIVDTPSPGTEPGMRTTRTAARSSAWLATGNVIYGVSQFVLVGALARTQDAGVVGAFTLAMAIVTPVFLLADMNLRVAVATDPMRKTPDTDYRGVRERTAVLATLACLAIGFVLPPTREEFPLFVAVLLYRLADSLSNLSYGFAFRENRARDVGRSMIGRGAISIIAGSVVLVWLSQPALAVGAIALCWIVAADREWRRFGLGPLTRGLTGLGTAAFARLVRTSGYLGVDGLITSLHFNIPRYIVQGSFGVAELGVYGAVGTLTNGVSIVAGSVSNVVLPRLAVHYQRGELDSFRAKLIRLVAVAVAGSIPVIVFSATWGDDFMGVLLGSEYAEAALVVALTVGACLNIVGQFLAKGLQAAQAFRAYLCADFSASATTALVVIPSAQAWGIAGAAWAVAIGSAARLVVTVFLVRNVVARAAR